MKPWQPYLIRWRDASFSWDNPDGEVGAICQCIGWFVGEDEHGIRLAFEVGENVDDGSRFHMDIPHGCILETVEL